MRVLLVHNRYRSPSGEERHIDLLEEWLPRCGVEVRRFEVTSPVDASILDQVRIGVSLTYRPAGARLLRQALARENPDIVHCHNLFPLLTSAAVLEAHRHGIPVVLTVHNYRFACPVGTLFRNGRVHEDCIEGSSLLCGLRTRGMWGETVAYGVALELQRRLRLLHRSVDAYVAPSQFVARLLARAKYPSDRIHTIYHGTPIADVPPPIGSYALYAGRLSPEKGIKTLLEASHLARNVRVVIAGAGPMAGEVRDATDERISYLGHVGQLEMPALRERSRFTVVPSHYPESLSFAALESMALGRPVVAVSHGGPGEIVKHGDTGIIVPPQDPLALASAMEQLSTDERLAVEMGRSAWQFARDHFSPREQARTLTELYERLITSPE